MLWNLAKWTPWKGTQQAMKLITRAAHMIVTRRRSLSDRADDFRLLFWLPAELIECVKLTELDVLVVLILVANNLLTIRP